MIVKSNLAGENKRAKKIYLLVLKEFLLLLQKQSDKYLIKFQASQTGDHYNFFENSGN